MLSYLNGHTDYIVCLATGAWRDSAVVKLQHAGFAHLNLPMVSSSDAVSREDILSLAIERTKASVVDQGINPIISVGDAVWDVWAARRLGLRFIGVGEGERAARLLLEGAPHVIPDYRDRRQFLDLLATAAPVA